MNLYRTCLLLCLVGFSCAARAGQPAEFSIIYDAHYGSLRAESERSLSFDENTQTYHMQAQSKILLLGRTMSSITETAAFGWQDNLPVPLNYQFVQAGVKDRTRSITFDQNSATLAYQLEKKAAKQLPLLTPVYDDLSSFLVIRQQLQSGATELYFDVLDKDNVKTYHYRVLDEENLQTALGDFAVVHMERIREENSKRTTEFWLAKDYDYILLKLLQEEPNGSLLQLEISAASLNDVPLQGLQDGRLNELGVRK